MPTTVGRLMLQAIIPEEYHAELGELPKDKLDALLARVAATYPDRYKEISHALTQLGADTAFRQGSTLRLSDTATPFDTKPLLEAMDTRVAAIRADKKLSDTDKRAAIIAAYSDTNKAMVSETMRSALAAGNPFALQVASKARGNPSQLTALMTTPGLYEDADGNVIPVFVRRSYAQGLRPHEYAASAYGARKSIIATKFCLAAGTQVRMADYSARAIEDILPGEQVLACDFRGATFPETVTHVHDQGEQLVADRIFRDPIGDASAHVTCTDNHRLMCASQDATWVGYLRGAGDIGPVERVVVIGIDGRPLRYQPVGEMNQRTARCYDLTVDNRYHLFVLANGMAVSNSTQDAGFLGKQMAAAAASMLVTEDDCGTQSGMPVDADNVDNVGAMLARSAAGFPAGTPVTRHVLSAMKKANVEKILLRSPITCGAGRGVCQRCAGLRENGKLPPIGYNLGLNATSALAERVAQGQLNCLEEGTLVRMADYTTRRIEDVRIGEHVLGASTDGVTFPVRVSGVWDQGLQPVRDYTYGAGNTRARIVVTGTAIHGMLCSTTKSGCKEAALNNVPRKLPLGYRGHDVGLILPTRNASAAAAREPYAAVMGMILGDGCRTVSGYPVFSCADAAQIADVRAMLGPLGFAVKKCTRSLDWRIVDRMPTPMLRDPATGRLLRGARNRMRVALQRVGLWGKYAHEKRLPADVFSWSDESIAQLIAGYLVTDGSVYPAGGTSGVAFGSTSKALLEGVRELLAVRLCVYSSAITRTGRAGDGRRVHDMWAFTITRNEAVRRLHALVSPYMFGVKKARWDGLIAGMPPVRRGIYRCPRKSVSAQRIAHCWDLTVDHPDHLFVLANGAITENTKHSGGAASAKSDDDFAGFETIKQLTQAPSTFPNRAAVSELDGRVEDILPAPQGGSFVVVNGTKHYVRQGSDIRVKPGYVVEAGDQLSGGIVNPREVVQHKGLGAGRLYMAERLTRAFTKGGYAANRRNVEVVARSMLDHIEADDFDDTSGMMPGEVISYNQFQRSRKPRDGSAYVPAAEAHNQYLEEPALHYTVGTRVTPSVSKQLSQFGVEKVLVHKKPLGVSPHMLSLQEVPHAESDWLAQMGSNYLGKSLAKSVHRGATSDRRGMHPIPAIAYGVELGAPKKPGKVGY